jgi:glycosyltransferase involved in cell wall biosynthesis
MLKFLEDELSFLMVGTLEPRKGHTQVLDAFELMWEQGENVILVIVGKQGWMVERLTKRLKGHSELHKRLFWFQGISDEYLEMIYRASTCLIAASEGEGFGLPLIEAAQNGLSIIARDISVFREVAGEHVSYFEGSEPEKLANHVREWLIDYNSGTKAHSNNIPWLTWEESAENLKSILLCRPN